MIGIIIHINMREIARVSAVNVSEANGLVYGEGTQLYDVYDEEGKPIGRINHAYEDGAVELAKKLLEEL